MSSIALTQAGSSSRRLHISLWTAQILLALMFGMTGLTKLSQPIAALGANMPWTLGVPAWVVRFNGIAELAGAIGLLLPSLTRIQPRLTALAAFGLTTVMVLAVGLHIMRSEFAVIPVPFVLGALAAFVAWGRGVAAPIAARVR